MIRVNLLPHREEKRKRRQQQFVGLAVFSAILALVVAGAIWFFLDQQVEVSHPNTSGGHAQCLREIGRAGVDMARVPVSIEQQLRQTLPQLELAPADEQLRGLRLVKLESEIALLETAALHSEKGLVSALNHTKLISQAIRKGAQDFIAKPFKPNDLRVVIEKAAKQLKG